MNPEKKLSVVVPVYNEESNIEPFHQAISKILDKLDASSEIIFVDDGSSDGTYDIVKSLSEKDGRIKGIRFSRNFGSHAAVYAGLRFASGDAAIMISVDLQDPPELIPELVLKWKEGYHVVWAVREGRDDPFLKKAFAALFYNLFRRIALRDYPKTGMDFGLFDRVVIHNLRNCHELNAFITGMIVWMGFRQAQVPYYRKDRHSGISKWSARKRVKAALDAIVSFSYFPIRFISYLGILISFFSLIYAGVLIVGRVFFGMGGAGWPSVMVTVLSLGGVQLITLGVLGEYIWRGSEQVRGRPPFIIMDAMGFDRPIGVETKDPGKENER